MIAERIGLCAVEEIGGEQHASDVTPLPLPHYYVQRVIGGDRTVSVG